MSTIQIKKISIVDLDTDAIVNAANSDLLAGGGVCGAVFSAAGYSELQDACSRIGHCSTGSAVITPGFHLKAKYIIHAVGPIWRGGKQGEPQLLYGAYYKALELAAEHHCGSIGFPLISAGIYGYPTEDAWKRAMTACAVFLKEHQNLSINVVFAVLNDEMLAQGKKALRQNASAFKTAERGDWKTFPMPEKHTSFILRRAFSAQQTEALRRGNIPQEMEDKWFWYMEGDTLYAHRSWTGICIYRIDFKPDNNHVVTVNQDPEQFTCTDKAEIAKLLNDLLNWWTQEAYDYYHEWLAETVAALKRAGKIEDPPEDSGEGEREKMRKQIISQFAGLTIDMDYVLCEPAVHAKYQEEEIVVDYCGEIRSASDRFPKDKAELLIRWVALHRKEIEENHGKIGAGVGPLTPIKPL